VARAEAAFSRNHLLKSLSPEDRDLLLPRLELIAMPTRHVVEERNKEIKHVYFVEEGIVSVVLTADNAEVEIGLIGCEGMSGLYVLLGNHQSPYKTYAQVSGRAHRIDADEFRGVLVQSETLRALLLRYVQAYLVQTSHTAIANARATLEQRLARWTLMAQDRLDDNIVPLTHEFLSIMLGVRRAGVTVAIHALQERGLIKASRGRITVLDRKALKKIAGTFYGAPEAELRRLMGDLPIRPKSDEIARAFHRLSR
jgi:CRP-like cAMP-binding protein